MIQVVQNGLKYAGGWGQTCRLGCGERSVGVFDSSPPPPWKTPTKCCPGLGNRPRKAISTSSLPYPPRALAGEVGVLAAIPLAREKKRDSVVAEPQFKGGRK